MRKHLSLFVDLALVAFVLTCLALPPDPVAIALRWLVTP